VSLIGLPRTDQPSGVRGYYCTRCVRVIEITDDLIPNLDRHHDTCRRPT
jgi:hypothetical protein